MAAASAVAIAFLVVAGGVLYANNRLALVPMPRSIDPTELVALLVGGAIATLIGVLDDTLQLRARWQLLGQVALAAFAVWLGITVTFINNPFGTQNIDLVGPYAVGFTVVWIVGMINSINFIDGLDGLSSGIALIAAITLGLISLTTATNQPFIAVLCFALAGSLLGFLRWNFHPASIFIGTSGVMFVGYTLALLSILGSAKVAVALLVLGVPIIDTFWIIVRRLATGRSPFTPDRGHIHHRLLDMGLTHGQTVLVIYGICILLAVMSLVLSGTQQAYAFMGLVVAFGLVLFLVTRGESGDALEAESYEPADSGPGLPAAIPTPARGPASPRRDGGSWPNTGTPDRYYWPGVETGLTARIEAPGCTRPTASRGVMQALPLVLVVVLVIVAAAAVVFLRRRRHAATEARLAAASSPVPELSEDDIAWRIGLLDDRPLLLSEFFAGAENEAMEAAEQELGTPILPILPRAPGAAPVPVTLAAAVGAPPAEPVMPRPPSPRPLSRPPRAPSSASPDRPAAIACGATRRRLFSGRSSSCSS